MFWITTDEQRDNDLLLKKQKMKIGLSVIVAASALVLCLQTFAANSSEPENSTPQDVFDGMRHSFRADKARGVHARYQWELTGPNGGQWWIEVNDGKFKMERGRIDKPDVVFIASDQTWVAMSNGKLKGSWAYMTGRLKVRGNQSVARKLDEIFP